MRSPTWVWYKKTINQNEKNNLIKPYTWTSLLYPIIHACTQAILALITCVLYPPSYEALWYFRLIRKYCNIPIGLKPGVFWYMWYFKELNVFSILRRHLAPRRYLNQCWVIVKCTPRNKFQWHFDPNTKLSFTKMHLKISSSYHFFYGLVGCIMFLTWFASWLYRESLACRLSVHWFQINQRQIRQMKNIRKRNIIYVSQKHFVNRCSSTET